SVGAVTVVKTIKTAIATMAQFG
ncbi:hypothetical protein Q604_UNBC04078G0001, partial [human gut metagenome]